VNAPRGRLLAAPALLAGVACAFVGCVLAGRLVAAHNCFADFRRFHHAISPGSLFYPTASQVLALGRDRLDRNRIAVIVGGSSILRGYGQGPDELWTRHLQDELGDGYRVLNLAMDGGRPAEFGGTAAEMLAGSFPRLLLVSDVFLQTGLPGAPLPAEVHTAAIPEPDVYGYFFWDAYFKGLIPAGAARRDALRAAARRRAADARFAEPMRGLRLESIVRSRDLWTTLAGTHLCTVWAPPPAPTPFTLPRGRVTETRASAAAPDLEAIRRYNPNVYVVLREFARREAQAGTLLLARAGPGLRAGEAPYLVFPPALRGRTLLLSGHCNPALVGGFSPAEQSAYRAAFPVFVRALENAGFAALEVGAGYSAADFVDNCHLTASGARKLAAEVAPAVRRLARRLGYDRPARVDAP
jgi:hypothetical protein